MNKFSPQNIILISINLIILSGLILNFYSTKGLQNKITKIDSTVQVLGNKVDKFVDPSNDISKSLTQLKNELATYRTEQPRDGTTTPTPSIIPITNIRLKSNWKAVDVFENPLASSKIVGQITSGVDYPIISKNAGWYFTLLPSGQEGYVQSQFIDEINY